MPLPFSYVCDLLEQCSNLCAARQKHHPAVVNWFNRHRALIDDHDTDVAALLSTLLPEKRTDRVYCIQAASLEKIIGRALMLGSSRIKELALHKIPGKGMDLADCVERILITTVRLFLLCGHRGTEIRK
jgi:DNA ligase-4